MLSLTFRLLRRNPLFTLTAAITLAIGIGANTAIFSVVNGVLLKPLPYPEADSLVSVRHNLRVQDGTVQTLDFTPSMYFTYKQEAKTFEAFGIWTERTVSITGLAEPEQVSSLGLTHDLLITLRVSPALGRPFSQSDDTPGSPDTVILSDGYWQRRFGRNPNVIGQRINIDSRMREVVGVMPSGFQFLNTDWQVLLPLPLKRTGIGLLDDFSYKGLGRLKPGINGTQATTDMRRVISIWLHAWGAAPALIGQMERSGIAPLLPPFKQTVAGNINTVLWTLMGTVGLVLLIACANVANLVLVRAEGRQHEFAVRTALGASWRRLARDLLAESLSLGLLGGMAGVGLAFAGVRLLVANGPATLPRIREVGLDTSVLLFAAGISILASVLFGAMPVVKYAGTGIARALRSGGRSATTSRERNRTRNVLVVAQVAVALVLMIASGLMIRSFQALNSIHPGFTETERIQMVRISIPQSQVPEKDQVFAMQKDMLDRIAAIPGVSSAAYVTSPPLEPYHPSSTFYDADKVYEPGQIGSVYQFSFQSPGALETLGTKLAAGRDFTWTDVAAQAPVTLVSAGLARQAWGSVQAALGKRIRQGRDTVSREIVGVVEDMYSRGLDQKPPLTVYWPARAESTRFQGIWRATTFLVRTDRAGSESLLAELRRAIWTVNPDLPLFDVRTLRQTYDASLARTSFTLVILAIAGSMSLMLSLIGLYGVLAYAVAQRTREVGIRIAIGAQPQTVKRMFLRHGLIVASIGIAVGLVAAAALSRLMSSLLFGVKPLDVSTYAVTSGILLLAAIAASYVPARRAASIDPIRALRGE